MAEDTLREAIEAAVEQAEAEAGEAIENAQAAQAEATPPQDEPPQEDGSGTPGEGIQEAASGSGSDGDDTPPADDPFLGDDGYPQDAERYPRLTRERVNRAPDGWRPAAREGWGDLPEPVRREIHRREADIANGMQDAADSRRLAEQFHTLTEPYRPLIAAEGAKDALDAVEGLFKTAATLAMGTPAQKANRLAQLVTHYGVDLDALDTALAAHIRGEAPPGDPQAPQGPKTALEARLERLEAFERDMATRVQGAEAQQAQSLESELASFAEGKDFFEDVRLDMADLMDVAARRGRSLSLQEAYDTACRMHPQVSKVMAQRAEEAARMRQASTTANKVRTASASLRPGQVGGQPRPTAPAQPGGHPDPTGGLRNDILAAIEQLEEG